MTLNIHESIVPGYVGEAHQRLEAVSVEPLSSGANRIRAYIDQFAAQRATTPRALSAADRKALIRELKGLGYLEIRHSMETAAHYLGVSRATVYTGSQLKPAKKFPLWD